MFITAAIFKNGHHWVKGQICVFVIVFFVILGSDNVYLDTKNIF